ncbi:MAG: hypothetical protein ACOYIB_00135 [Desulfosporosinus sp.]|jgi:hypothetical protein
MKLWQKYLYLITMLLLVAIISSGMSFSRYSSTVFNTGDYSGPLIPVEEYGLVVTWDPRADTVPPGYGLQYPGITDQNYNFTLKNTKDTALNYTLNIGLSWSEDTPVVGLNVPLVMELYIVNTDTDEGESLTPVALTTSPGSPAGMQVMHHTQPAVISGNELINYRMLWSWGTGPADRNYHFANKKIEVTVNVNAEQRIEE